MWKPLRYQAYEGNLSWLCSYCSNVSIFIIKCKFFAFASTVNKLYPIIMHIAIRIHNSYDFLVISLQILIHKSYDYHILFEFQQHPWKANQFLYLNFKLPNNWLCSGILPTKRWHFPNIAQYRFLTHSICRSAFKVLWVCRICDTEIDRQTVWVDGEPVEELLRSHGFIRSSGDGGNQCGHWEWRFFPNRPIHNFHSGRDPQALSFPIDKG